MAAKKRATKRRSTFRTFLTWHPPEITLGDPKPLPESRPAIRDKIIARLDATGPFRQEYSNGEFISSSYAIARTFEEAKAVQALEMSSYVVHYDETLNIYWRRTGCFD